MPPKTPDLILYTFYRSSCAARLRIALNLKSIPVSNNYVDVMKGEQFGAEYASINPYGTVPTLHDTSTGALIPQSVAALEYLEERYPESRPLLPPASDFAGRAHVRTLIYQISSDVQPIAGTRNQKRIEELAGPDAAQAWGRQVQTSGFAAYEKLVKEKAGRFSYGDEITLADVVLVPQIYRAMGFGVDLEQFPTLKKIFENMEAEEAVQRAHWKRQGDTPEEFRH
jgi:maleylacetoacetate isomerase